MIRVPFVRKDQKRFINYFSYECSLSYRSWKQFENFWFMLLGKYVEFTLKDVFVARQAGESDQLLNYLFILGKLHERMSPKTAWNYKNVAHAWKIDFSHILLRDTLWWVNKRGIFVLFRSAFFSPRKFAKIVRLILEHFLKTRFSYVAERQITWD